jgi:hypothetical protein
MYQHTAMAAVAMPTNRPPKKYDVDERSSGKHVLTAAAVPK